MKRKTTFLLLSVILVLVVAIAYFAILIVQNTQKSGPVSTSTPTTFSTSMLHVEGTHLVDTHDHQILLRGAQIESPFNYIKRWDSGEKVSTSLNSTIFQAMVHDWNMNALRLPLSNWIYAKDTANYMSQLDQVVQEANSAGLYVVLDLHDNRSAGAPYPDTGALPKTEDIPFWKAIAGHYKNNPMVLFDLYNEPQDPNWQTWLHGGGVIGKATAVGFQDLVDAVRSVGAHQVLVVEPGSAGKGGGSPNNVDSRNAAEEGGWTTIGNNTINDPNILYSLHVYQYITNTPQQEDAKWGPILNHYPLYYGEWAFLPNGTTGHCKTLPNVPAQADQTVQSFLNYMAARDASWTAWQFAPDFLVTDLQNFQPTTLDTAWTCGSSRKQTGIGMGTIVKRYLTGYA